MTESKDIPCLFYLYLHSKIWEMAQGEVIPEKKIKKYLFQWKIPKKMRGLIIRELIMLGLLKEDKQYHIKIKRPKFSEEDINIYSQKLGIF